MVKRILLFIFGAIALLFLSNAIYIWYQNSKTPKEKLQDIIEDKIKFRMNDPKSYEFDYFSIDSTEYHVGKKILNDDLKNLENFKISNNVEKIKETETSILIQEKINKISSPFMYKGYFKFRGKNKFGATILAEYKVHADSTYKLMYLIDNIGDTIYKDIDLYLR